MFTHSKTGIENVIKLLENIMEGFKKIQSREDLVKDEMNQTDNFNCIKIKMLLHGKMHHMHLFSGHHSNVISLISLIILFKL